MKRLTGVTWLFVALIFAGAACAQATHHSLLHSVDKAPSRAVTCQIRMDYDPLQTPLPIVYVSINRHAPLPFLLDTGSDGTVYITNWAARKLKLRVSYRETALISNTHEVFPLIHVAEVAFVAASETGQQRVHVGSRSKEAVIMDWSLLDYILAGRRVAGVIGADMFAKETIRLDFDARTLSLLPHTFSLSSAPNAIILPLKKKGGRHLWVTLHDRQNHAIDVMLDTGCQTLNLLPRQAAMLGLLKTSQQKWVTTFGESHRVQIAIWPTLQLGPWAVPNVVAQYPTDDKVKGETKLGMNVLGRYRVTISFAHSQLTLEPAARAASRSRLPGLSVVEVTLRKHRILVGKVVPGSAAARASLHLGDQILEVDQMPVRKIPDASLQDAVDGYADTQADLLVQQGGRVRHVRYPRYSLAQAVQRVDQK